MSGFANYTKHFKQFAVEFGVQYVIDVAWGYVLFQIKDCSPEDVYKAIEEDIDLWEVTPGKEKVYVQNALVRRFRPYIHKYADRITPELILQGLQKDRPDIVGVIINFPDNKGLEWLNRQTENIISTIKSM